MLPYIFFDAAGTLFHLKESVGNGYSRLSAPFGFQLNPAATNAAFRAEFSSSIPVYADGPTEEADRIWWKQLVTNVFTTAGENPDHPNFDACFDFLFDHYGRAEAWQLFPETLDTLRKLARHGFELGVLSNFDARLHAILSEFEIDHFFSHVVVSSEFAAAKPEAEFFHAAAAHAGRVTSDSILVGDDPIRDREGALASGFQQVHLVDRPATTLSTIAESLISSESS